MRLRKNHGQPGPQIEAAEIERAKFIVIKFLLLHRERTVERAGKARRVGHARGRRKEEVALLTAPDERHVRSVKEWCGKGDRKWLGALDSFQDFLFANV